MSIIVYNFSGVENFSLHRFFTMWLCCIRSGISCLLYFSALFKKDVIYWTSPKNNFSNQQGCQLIRWFNFFFFLQTHHFPNIKHFLMKTHLKHVDLHYFRELFARVGPKIIVINKNLPFHLFIYFVAKDSVIVFFF